MNSYYISVGIPTDGDPVIESIDGGTSRLRNMLIGLGFHWQQTVEAILPGDVSTSDDALYSIINRLPVEQYLACVIGSEMNPEAPIEFLKAHAVISRSWAMGKIDGSHQRSCLGKRDSSDTIIDWEDTCDHHGFDVCSDDHCQRYQGIQPLHYRLREAIASTEGLVLRAPDGSIVDARFSKCCGGRTEVFSSCWQPEEPSCLKSFDDPWCDLSGLSEERRQKVLSSILKEYDLANNGGFAWTATVTAEEIKSNLRNKFGRDIGDIEDVRIVARGPSGRATALRLTGSKGELSVGKELMIRRLLAPTHLYSSCIELTPSPGRPGRYDIIGRGWGHGVGLCQIGAARMALDGYSFRDILAFYYPGSVLTQ